jgi:hypothetical protein
MEGICFLITCMNSASAFPFYLHVNFWKACVIHVMLECHWHSTGIHTSDIFIHSVVPLMTGPQPLPKPVLHTVWSSASSFSFLYTLLSWVYSSSCLHLLPVTSNLPSVVPSVTCFRRQFLYKMWPIQLAFLIFTTIRQGRDQPNNHQIPLHTLAGHSNDRVSQLRVPPEARGRLHRQWPAHRRTAITDTTKKGV